MTEYFKEINGTKIQGTLCELPDKSRVFYITNQGEIKKTRSTGIPIIDNSPNGLSFQHDQCLLNLGEKIKDFEELTKFSKTGFEKLDTYEKLVRGISLLCLSNENYSNSHLKAWIYIMLNQLGLTNEEIDSLSKIHLFDIDMQFGFSEIMDDLPVPGMINAHKVREQVRKVIPFNTIFETYDEHEPNSLTFFKTFGLDTTEKCISVLAIYDEGTPNEYLKELLLWTKHCVSGTDSADKYIDENKCESQVSENIVILKKGKTIEEYSPFFDDSGKPGIGINELLRTRPGLAIIDGVAEGGYCVTTVILHLILLGIPVVKISDAIGGIDYPAGSIQYWKNYEEELGVKSIRSTDLLTCYHTLETEYAALFMSIEY